MSAARYEVEKIERYWRVIAITLAAPNHAERRAHARHGTPLPTERRWPYWTGVERLYLFAARQDAESAIPRVAADLADGAV